MSAAPLLAPVYRVAGLREIESRHSSAPLMERAGQAAAGVASAMLGNRAGRVVVLAGPGNNGGDGFVVARRLRERFHDVAVVFRGALDRLPPDAAAALRAMSAAGGMIERDPPPEPPALVIDALFGIGLARHLAPEYATLVGWANAAGAPILALDVPTGLDADTGAVFAPAIRADATATFIAYKPGLLTGGGPDLAGVVTVHALELNPDDPALAAGHALNWFTLSSALPEILRRRARDVHKGSFGTLAIVGGAAGMVGAPILAGRAAVHLGAGKVWLGFVSSKHPDVDLAMPEMMLRGADDVFDGANALVVGCGLGRSVAAQELVARALAIDAPLALDADALNVIAASPSLLEVLRRRTAPTLATPHPAEAARLLGTDTASVQRDRVTAAQTLSNKLGAYVVLKGAGSVLAHPDGTWDINASGNPALASAGTGDALAGMLGALLAQGVEPKAALRLAVCLHGAAADALVARGIGPLGVGASELASAARDLVNRAR